MNDMTHSSPAKVLGIISIVFGGIGFLLCPILFGLAGVVCGVVGMVLAKDEPKTLAIIGTCLSAVSIPVGMILGMITEEALNGL